MGELADEMFDVAMREEELRTVLMEACKKPPEQRQCRWEINDDGLFECSVCGEVTDI